MCISMGATSLHCGSCVSAGGGVSLPGRKNLTVRAESPGMFSFEILMHCGSWGVLWGVVGPAGVTPVCCADDCARGSDAHAHAHTQTHTPLLYGYTAAQQDLAFVGLEYTQRVHPACIHCTLSLTEGVKLPNAPAANTWERDERLSQQAAIRWITSTSSTDFKLHYPYRHV